MRWPKVPAMPVLAGAIACVLGASIILVGVRGGSTPPPGPSAAPRASETAEPSPSPIASPSRTATRAPTSARPRPTTAPTRSVKPGRCGGVDADFNGDGYADLAIGVPGKDTEAATDAGVVYVTYGARSGLSQRTQTFSQQTPGIQESADESDHFGETLTTGDFNGDGYTDLAVGVPGEVITGFGDGAVNVIYGSRRGLTTKGNQVWHQDSPGMPEEAASAERFGKGLAAGDFNRDGYSDLAIGSPFEDIRREGFLSAYGSAGALTIVFGSRAGITTRGAQLITQDSPGVPDDVEAVDLFGWAIASGDFDRDGFCDIAASAPGERIDGEDHAGTVTVLYGAVSAFSPARGQLWHQNVDGVPGRVDADDEFGRTLAIGDFDADGYADLAIGAHGETVNEKNNAGSVTVLHGSRRGLTVSRVQAWTQDSEGIGDAAESNEGFSLGLTTGDFDGDGASDLSVGVPFETFPPTLTAEPITPGIVHVLFGVRGKGLRAAGSQIWDQDSPGVTGSASHEDKFGLSVGAGDLNGDGRAELIVGAPGEDAGAGVVHVLFGSTSGVSPSGNLMLGEGRDGFPDDPSANDGFGSAMAAS